MTTPKTWQARRRLRALHAQGFTTEQIANTINATVDQVTDWTRDPSTTIPTHHVHSIIRAYRAIDNATGGVLRPGTTTPHPDGWLPPAAWDNIDNPHEQPTYGRGRDHLTTITDQFRHELQARIEDAADRTAPPASTSQNVEEPSTGPRKGPGTAHVAEQVGVSPHLLRALTKGQQRRARETTLDLIATRLGLTPTH